MRLFQWLSENHIKGRQLLLIAVFATASAPILAQVGPISPTCLVLPASLRTPQIEHKVGQVSQILDELAAERRSYIENGKIVDIFSVLYFRTTQAELKNALRLDPAESEADLDSILAFYDSYRANRQRFDNGLSVEKHWRRYYSSAKTLEKGASSGIFDPGFLVLDGIDAHLKDLARVLKYTFPKLRISQQEFEKLYFDMDAMFVGVPEAIDKDIEAGPSLFRQLAAVDRSFHFGTNYVTQARHRAWEAAVSGKKLVAGGLPPILEHDDRSRTFISLTDDPRCFMP